MSKAYPWNTKVLPPGHTIGQINEGYFLRIHRDEHPETPYLATVDAPNGRFVHHQRHKYLADARRVCINTATDDRINLTLSNVVEKRPYHQTNRKIGI